MEIPHSKGDEEVRADGGGKAAAPVGCAAILLGPGRTKPGAESFGIGDHIGAVFHRTRRLPPPGVSTHFRL